MELTPIRPTLRELQRRTADELGLQAQSLQRYGSKLDLRELVLSKTRHPLRPLDERKVSAWSELSESLRQRGGNVPSGTWVPLKALTRDLTTSNSSSLSAARLDRENAASLLPGSAVIGGGATVLSGLNGSSYGITTTSALDPTDGWINEADPVPQREPTFGESRLTPKSLSVTVTLSRRLLHDAAVDVNALLSRELVARLSHAIDLAAIAGNGTTQPLGLLGNADLEVLDAGANGAAPTWEHLVNLEHSVATRAGQMAAPAFLMSPALAKKLRTTQRVSGGDLFLFEGRDLLGYPVRVSPNVPDNLTKGTSSGVCSALVLGDLAELAVGFWGPAAIDLLVDDVTGAKDGRVRIIARADVGIAPIRVGAFAAFKDLLTA
ncbi:MAG: phage major capsid protein [Tepidimonas taiwanensis]|nr:phage major capsid protein [Tepidimonas taiwanensis]